jgi:hypothetical protein
MHTEAGFTRDVSVNAFFVITRAELPLEAHLQCQILMPASLETGGNVIAATGQVTRLSNEAEGPGFVLKAKLHTASHKAKTRVH